MTDQPDAAGSLPLDADKVRGLCGNLLDSAVVAIVETGGTVADLEIALAWAEGEDDVMGEAREPLTGAAAAIYDLLTAEIDVFEEP